MTDTLLTAEPAAAFEARSETSSYARLAWGVTLGTWLVILFGAVVRITGSGAGCGQHWPSCNGEIAHLPRSIETAIELTHRATSGLALLAVVALVVVATRRFAAGHAARRYAYGALGFMLVESLLGAGLVLLNLVGSNSSVDRAVMMPLHLVTTSLLLGCLGLSAHFAGTGPAAVTSAERAAAATALRWVLVAGACLLVLSMTGAVTALGDTVYPVQGSTTLERLQRDQQASAHFLGRLRVIHPILALLVVGLLSTAAARARRATAERSVGRWARAVSIIAGVAVVVGFANVALGAPGPMQVLHLAVACALWLAVVLLGAVLWQVSSPARAQGRASG